MKKTSAKVTVAGVLMLVATITGAAGTYLSGGQVDIATVVTTIIGLLGGLGLWAAKGQDDKSISQEDAAKLKAFLAAEWAATSPNKPTAAQGK